MTFGILTDQKQGSQSPSSDITSSFPSLHWLLVQAVSNLIHYVLHSNVQQYKLSAGALSSSQSFWHIPLPEAMAYVLQVEDMEVWTH